MFRGPCRELAERVFGTGAGLCGVDDELLVGFGVGGEGVRIERDLADDRIVVPALAASLDGDQEQFRQWLNDPHKLLELIAAAQGLEYRAPLQPGKGVKRAYESVRQRVAPLLNDRSMSAEIESIVKSIQSGEFDS